MNKRAGELTAEELDTICAVIANPLEYNVPKYFLNSQVRASAAPHPSHYFFAPFARIPSSLVQQRLFRAVVPDCRAAACPRRPRATAAASALPRSSSTRLVSSPSSPRAPSTVTCVTRWSASRRCASTVVSATSGASRSAASTPARRAVAAPPPRWPPGAANKRAGDRGGAWGSWPGALGCGCCVGVLRTAAAIAAVFIWTVGRGALLWRRDAGPGAAAVLCAGVNGSWASRMPAGSC